MASPISFSGMASGIDSGALITALVGQAKVPMNQLSAQKSEFSSQSKKLSDIKTKLTTLQTAAKALDTTKEALANKASSSDEKVLKATALGGASMGSFKLEVTSIAQAERTYSDTFSDDDTAGLLSPGTLTLQVGTGDPIEIEVTAEDTLATVATKINSSGARVSAGVFHDGTNYRLQVTSRDSGTANAITFGESGGLALGLSSAENEKQAATDAIVKIDGLEVKSASNTISGAVPGVTLNLVDKGTSIIQLDRDGDALKGKLNTFITAYNDVMKTLNTEFSYSGVAKGRDSLMGDGTVRTLQSALRGLVSKVTENAGSTLTTLGSIGIAAARDGTLSFDDAKYTKAVGADYEGVASLLAGRVDGHGLMSSISDGLDSYARSDGTLRTKIDNLAARNRRIDGQITNMQRRVDKYEELLQKQYASLEQVIGGLQSQGNALASVMSSM